MNESPGWRARPPVPSSISVEAQRYLAQEPPFPVSAHPELDDDDGWHRWVEEQERPIRAMFASTPPSGATVRLEEIGGVPTYVVCPTGVEEAAAPIVVEAHGGGLVMCGKDLAWRMSAPRIFERHAVTWFPDYRMPPLHPFPAALNDCMAVYVEALARRTPAEILLCGASAGGNLAAAMVLRATTEGLAVPAALVLLTPELDLTESGDTFTTNLDLDFMNPLMPVNRLYANGRSLEDPFVSPLFGDVTGFPPTLLQAGTRDMFLSNVARMHRKLLEAGVVTELHVCEAMPHGSFGGDTPEDHELRRSVLAFERKYIGWSRRCVEPAATTHGGGAQP